MRVAKAARRGNNFTKQRNGCADKMPSKVHSPNSKVVAPDELSGPSALDGLVATLVTDRVTYFPIRHHSPACAQHLEGLIRKWKPSAILIEGPASFTSLIPLI